MVEPLSYYTLAGALVSTAAALEDVYTPLHRPARGTRTQALYADILLMADAATLEDMYASGYHPLNSPPSDAGALYADILLMADAATLEDMYASAALSLTHLSGDMVPRWCS